MVAAYFQVAEPLSKEEFLSVYKDSILLIQLIFAPFGITENSIHVVGSEEKVIEMYSSVFQQYEDIVSKRLFKLKGYDDDRIIASMHKYVGETRDADIISELEIASRTLKLMINPSNCIEFDFPIINEEHNIINSFTTSLLLDQVLTALKPLLYGEGYQVINGDIFIDGKNLYKEDLSISSILPIHIPINTFSPVCTFSKMPFKEASLQSVDSIHQLLNSLTISINELLPNSINTSVEVGINQLRSTDSTISFSLMQYHCLLDHFGEDPLVQRVLTKHMNMGRDVGGVTIQDVRNGSVLNSLNLSTQPSISFINQLEYQLRRLTKSKSILDDKLEGDCKYEGDITTTLKEVKDELNRLIMDIQNIETALLLVQSSLNLREEAQKAAVVGDLDTAIMLISEELLDYLDTDSSDEEDEDDDADKEDQIIKPKQILPTYLKVASFIERASFYLDNNDLQAALKDCTSAIKLDSQCAKAYSMRSQINLQLLSESNEDTHDTEDENDYEIRTKQLSELYKAAEDALLAFLLDGSSDLTLASAAEEAAREACRMTAKEVFYNRHKNNPNSSQTNNSIENLGKKLGNDNFPRSWLVGSYFAAYEQISVGLSIYQPTNYFSKQINKYHMKTLQQQQQQHLEGINKLQDIDVDKSSNDSFVVKSISLEVPRFLQNIVLSDVVESSDESDIKEINHPFTYTHVPCERDSEGYALLICLSELIEAVTYDEFITLADNKASKKEHIEDINHHQYEHCIEPISVVSTSLNSDISINQVLGINLECTSKDLISEGLCEFKACITNTSTETKSCDEGVIPACKYYTAALQLLRGSISDIDEGSLKYIHFIDHWRLLNKTSIEELTGVVFSSTGNIETLTSYPVPSDVIVTKDDDHQSADVVEDVEKNENDEDGWETCDDEEEDNEEDEEEGFFSVGKNDKQENKIKEIETALSEINISILAESSRSGFDDLSHDNDVQHIDKISNTAVEEENIVQKEKKEHESIPISHSLRARLLNICGSFAYLAGDAIGAVKCFRSSIEQDPHLIDSQIKLGSLLVDMDELEEASTLLSSANSKDPNNMVILLHLAELSTHQNHFDIAIKHLRKARKLSESSNIGSSNTNTREIAGVRSKLLRSKDYSTVENTGMIHHYLSRVDLSNHEMTSNIHSLFGINQFRQSPQHPEIALYTLQSALNGDHHSNLEYENGNVLKKRESPILLLCCGEVYSQLGDMVNALNCFQKAHELAPLNPLCYVNAARTYQQLSQVATSEYHLQAALNLDPALAMVRVDLAQNLLLSGKASEALSLLEEALILARQVSEIRDVLTAKMIATIQIDLEVRGLYFNSHVKLDI